MSVAIRVDRTRGCGDRKPGALYLMSGALAAPCGLLPAPLDVCPCCGTGIKQQRGVQWVTPAQLIPNTPEHAASEPYCPLGNLEGRHLLQWIGEAFYKTPEDFLKEAYEQGVSRRIRAVPHGFKLGETWMLTAHPKAIQAPETSQMPHSPSDKPVYLPGIISAFKPDAIEYITKGDETPEQLEALEKRGITPVRVIKEQRRGERRVDNPGLDEVYRKDGVDQRKGSFESDRRAWLPLPGAADGLREGNAYSEQELDAAYARQGEQVARRTGTDRRKVNVGPFPGLRVQPRRADDQSIEPATDPRD